jgi:hypothetical protein
MPNQNSNEIEKSFKEMQEKAKEIYPDIDSILETFNSARLETENYLNYLSLLNENPLPIASNHTSK